MRDLSQLSGPWVGFWVQRGLRGSMGLALTFTGGFITGTGSDLIGAFRLIGSYTADGDVSLLKTYSWHVVDYKGNWDGQMIAGTWRIKYEGSGAFEIWPESESSSLEELYEFDKMQLTGT